MRISEDQQIPFGYGIAWREWNRCAVIVLPIGLHVVAAAVRAVWLRFRLGLHWNSVIDEACDAAFQSGLNQGRKGDYDAGYRAGVDDGLRAGITAERAAIRAAFSKRADDVPTEQP